MASKYAEEQIAEILSTYRTEGLREAARRHDVPARTISRWAQARQVSSVANEKTARATEAAKVRMARKRQRLRELLLDKALETLELMNAEHVDFKVVGVGDGFSEVREITFPRATSAGRRDYAVAAGILIDKLRLEGGEATAISEVSVDDAREHLARKLDQLAERRRAGRARPKPQPR